MADEILKSFLVSLGFTYDEAGMRRFHQTIDSTTKVVKVFAETVTGMAIAVEESIRRTARQFENLYYLSQRTDVTVQGIQSIRLAFQQAGLTAGDADSAISGFARSLRDFPGLRNLANSIAPGFKDAADFIEKAAERYRDLEKQFGPESGPVRALRAQLDLFGPISEKVRQISQNLDAFKQGLKDVVEIQRSFGLNASDAAKLATDAARQWNLVWTQISTGFDVFVTKTFPAVRDLLETFSKWLANEGAAEVKIWADQFNAWISNKDNIRDLTDGLVEALSTIASISKAALWVLEKEVEAAKLLKELFGGPQGTGVGGIPPEVVERMKREGKLPQNWKQGDPIPGGLNIPVEPFTPPSQQAPLSHGRGGQGQEFPSPDQVIPSSPAPIPGARKSSFGGDLGEDPLVLLLHGFYNWWRGDAAFNPIVTISSDFYGRIEQVLRDVFGLNEGQGGRADGTDGAGGTTYTPGKGYGFSSRGRGGGPLGFSQGNVSKGGTSLQEMVALARQAGFSEKDAPIIASIAMAESSGNLGAVGPAGERGLTQINPHAWNQRLVSLAASSPLGSFQAAKEVLDKQGWAAWSTYTTRNPEISYRRYLGAAMNFARPDSAKPGDITQGTGTGGGRFSAGHVNLGQVNQALVSTLQAAAGTLPKGYQLVATSGARTGGLGGSQHHGGQALDVQIVGPDGQPVANRGQDVSGMYGRLAHSWFNQVARSYPHLVNRAAWGGEFETSPGSSTPDLMHFDFGGRRGHFRQQPWHYIDSDHTTNITIQGHGADATARAVKDSQERQSALHMRNLRKAIA